MQLFTSCCFCVHIFRKQYSAGSAFRSIRPESDLRICWIATQPFVLTFFCLVQTNPNWPGEFFGSPNSKTKSSKQNSKMQFFNYSIIKKLIKYNKKIFVKRITIKNFLRLINIFSSLPQKTTFALD